MKLKTPKKTNVKDKKILLRLDLDVPVENFQIVDDTRLKAAGETLIFLNENNSKIFAVGHRGRPNLPLESEEEIAKYSLEPVALWFARFFNSPLEKTKIDGFEGWKIGERFYLLENLRFFKEEMENEEKFAKKLALLGDVFINDAFAVSHRKNASVSAVRKFLPSYAGFRLKKEVEILSEVTKNPKRPLVAIIGGAKIETKLPLVEKMHDLADFVLVGGQIAEETKSLLTIQHEKGGRKSVLLVADVLPNKKDITQKSAENFVQIIKKAKTVIWNGPLGFVEGGFEAGTKAVAEGIINSKAYSITGGGDTGRFLKSLNLYNKFSFVSVGGGAMLEFLSGKDLPGT